MKGLITLCPLDVVEIFQAGIGENPAAGTEMGSGGLCATLKKQTCWTDCPLFYYLFDYTMPCSEMDLS